MSSRASPLEGEGVAGHAVAVKRAREVDAVDGIAKRIGNDIVVAPVLVVAHEAAEGVDVGAQVVIERLMDQRDAVG